MKYSSFLARFSGLGVASLLALFLGGAALIFVGANGLLIRVPEGQRDGFVGGFIDPSTGPEEYYGFAVGARLGLQTWLAIIGAGFGCLSYGFLEAYYHAFDWWCSRRALADPGLDYARYLNTQSRAPVVYGIHGFPIFVTLRYLTVGLSLAASVGYKFGVVQTKILVRGDHIGNGSYPPTIVDSEHRLPIVEDLANQEIASGYVEKLKVNRRYYHVMPEPNIQSTKFYSTPPFSVAKLGYQWGCSAGVNYGSGYVVSQELALVANMTAEEDDFEMTRNDSRSDGWERLTVDNWTINTTAVVDYRIYDSAQMQIRWAPSGKWFTDPAATNVPRPTARRLTYQARYATAQVRRAFLDETTCGPVSTNADTVRLMSLAREPIPIRLNATTMLHKLVRLGMTTIKRYDNGMLEREALEYNDSERMPALLDGVSVFVRAVLAELPAIGFRCRFDEILERRIDCDMSLHRGRDQWQGPGPGPASIEDNFPPDPQNPLSKEATILWSPPTGPGLDYPYFNGEFTEGTKCTLDAAMAFIITGAFAVLVGAVRIWVGPPRLTSWAGQHVYLASIGKTPMSGLERAATGYMAAPQKLGMLRLSADGSGQALLPEKKQQEVVI